MKNGKGKPRKEWTAADKKRHAAIRKRFQRDKPTLEDLRKSGEYGPAIPLGDFLSLTQAVAALKRERERKGLSLADVARRSKIDKAALSRLENGLQTNPTVGTLRRYAAAVEAQLVYSVKPGEDGERNAEPRA